MRTATFILVLSSALLTRGATAEPNIETLAAAVSSIDELPTKAQLLLLGADAEGRALLELANDDKRSAYTRMRAVSFLAWFDSQKSRDGLVRLLEDERSPVEELRIQALRSLARLEGSYGRARLERYLRGPSVPLRLAAERAMAATAAVRAE
jgi:HEAT repeat protein